MLYRYFSVILVCSSLFACGDKAGSGAVPVSNVSDLNGADVVKNTIPAEKPALKGKDVAAPDSAPVLDLSLPAGAQGDVSDLSDSGKGRYGVGSWFDQSGRNEEQRFKMKTKLRLKKGAEFDKNSDISSYGDSVDGAEMGFEYKTR